MGLISDALSSLSGAGERWNWFEHLHPASFRGVPFAIVSGEGVFGRRQAVHEYPYRDTAWVEDLGRSSRKITLRGFIVQDSLVYIAPDVMTQRNSLVAACEMNGPGTLVHPTLGELTVSVPDGGLRITEAAETGRMFAFTLTVIESGLKVFAVTGNKQADSQVQTRWLQTAVTTAAKFISTIKGEMRSVTQTIKTLQNTAIFWSDRVHSVTNEATNLSEVLQSVFGSARYGRYNKGTVGGSVSGATGVVHHMADTRQQAHLVNQTIAAAVSGREKLLSLTAEFGHTLAVEDFPVNARKIIDALIAVPGSMDEKIRILETLAAYRNKVFYSTESENALSQTTTILLCVLSAGALASVAANYQPTSYDDAIAMFNRVCSTLDCVLLMAADAGDDDSYLALIETRHALAEAYRQKGALLSSLMKVTLPSSLPALTLAARLYQDGNRGDELIQSVQPRHPAFMPLTFKALRK